MREKSLTDAALRRFLLGQVDDEERQRIESLFLTDSSTRDRVLAAEQGLLDAYLEDNLPAPDKERFLRQYSHTPAQERKLRIAKSIKDWAATEAETTEIQPATTATWSRWRPRFMLRPAFAFPLVVTSLIAIVIVAVWLNGRIEQRNRRLALAQEVAQLNTPDSLRESPPKMDSLALSPVSVRSIERQAELTPQAEVPIVELRLLWIQEEGYANYRAVVRRIGDDESITIPGLQPETDDGHSIRIRLPTRILNRGLYQVELSGIGAGGAVGLTEEYRFTVDG